MEIQFTPEQEARLSQIADYNGTSADQLVKQAALRLVEEDEDDSPEAATRAAEQIYARIEELVTLPHRGLVGRKEGTRELVLPRCLSSSSTG